MTSHSIALRAGDELLDALDKYAKLNELTRSAAANWLIEKGLRAAGYHPQTQTTGAEAAERGKNKSRKVAKALGADSVSTTSNEFQLNGELVTIRYAAVGNKRFGCYNNVRDRVTYIICAHELTEGRFELYRVTSDQWRTHGCEASPGNLNRGHITFMALTDLKRIGESMGVITE